MAGLHHRGRLRSQPVSEHVEIGAGVAPLGQFPEHRLGRQIDGARSDVHLGQLRRDGLKRRQRLAELLAVGHIVSGQPQRPGHQTSGISTDHAQHQLVHPCRRGARQHVGIGDRDIGEGHRVLVGAVRRRGTDQSHTIGLGRHHHNATVGRHQHPVGRVRVSDTDFHTGQPPARKSNRRPVRQRRPGFVERGCQYTAARNSGQETVLLLLGREVEQRHHAETQGDQCRCDGAVATGFDEHRAHLGHAHAVAAETFGHR